MAMDCVWVFSPSAKQEYLGQIREWPLNFFRGAASSINRTLPGSAPPWVLSPFFYVVFTRGHICTAVRHKKLERAESTVCACVALTASTLLLFLPLLAPQPVIIMSSSVATWHQKAVTSRDDGRQYFFRAHASRR